MRFSVARLTPPVSILLHDGRFFVRDYSLVTYNYPYIIPYEEMFKAMWRLWMARISHNFCEQTEARASIVRIPTDLGSKVYTLKHTPNPSVNEGPFFTFRSKQRHLGAFSRRFCGAGLLSSKHFRREDGM